MPGDSPSRFVIVDPSLKDARGHHFALTERITGSVLHHGFRPVWLCHRDAEAAIASGVDADIDACLSVSLYDAYHAPKTSSFLAGRLQKPMRALHGKVKAGLRRSRLAATPPAPHERLASDLADAIDRRELGAADRLLFHTADGQTYAAIDHLFQTREPGDLPKTHLCTPYDPVAIMPNRVADRSIESCIERWRSAGWLGRHLHLHAENRLLASHLSTLWQTPVFPLELPAVQVEPSRMTNPDWPKSWRSDQLKVVLLGPARAEKGFHLLPDIIAAATGTERGRNTEICFAIQCSPQIIGYTPPIADAIAKLGTLSSSQVRMIDTTLDDASYLGWLATADVVLMPYGQREYGKRSSGIVTEALSLGKIIVATTGTYPASMIDEGAGVSGVDAHELGRAIATIAEDPEVYRKGAAIAGHAYRERNDPASYIERCLEAERARNTG